MNYFMYLIAGICLLTSYFTDKKKTKLALKKAWKSFENILPQFIGVIFIVGIVLSVFNADTISNIIGKNSGLIGMALSSIIGAITLIPGFVAFPMAALLLNSGAGYMQIAVFVSTLMMVGIVTMPVEIKCFGKKVTFLRNLIAFLFSFFVAYIIGRMV